MGPCERSLEAELSWRRWHPQALLHPPLSPSFSFFTSPLAASGLLHPHRCAACLFLTPRSSPALPAVFQDFLARGLDAQPLPQQRGQRWGSWGPQERKTCFLSVTLNPSLLCSGRLSHRLNSESVVGSDRNGLRGEEVVP